MSSFIVAFTQSNESLIKRCSEPGPRVTVAIHASRGPGR